MTVEFRLLGDVAMHVDGREVDVGHVRQRCVLAVLLADANRVVPVPTLADRVWAANQPRNARNALSGYVSRLRRLVTATGEARLVRQPSGYLLTVEPTAVDLHRFRHLVALARATPDGSETLTLLTEALRLWRGDAFANLDTPWLNGLRDALDAERLAAELDRNDLALDLGRHAELLPELTTRAATDSLDERLAGQLMLALYRNGRQADALHHYDRLRQRLAEELGTDPCPAVRRLHQRILAADPALSPAVSAAEAVPRQLPAPPAAFTGRAGELARLHALAAATSSTVEIAVVSGTAGVGKTALALHWAHQAATRFPDGQLYVNLRGFDPTGPVLSPADALRGFLEAFGVPPRSMPAGLDGQAALWRSTLAGKRVLVLLDNARDAEQVRPLLPGTPGCLVVVTSRNRLTALVADNGAHPVTLDLLDDGEARDLLAARVGAHRIAGETGAVREIIARCARLPLALTLTAARAATHPAFPLADLAAELAGADPLLTDLRAVFSWSYRTLTPPAARLFRLLGLHAGPEFTAQAAASLAGLPVADVRPLLAELADTHLVTEHTPGRFTMHDLLYAYAIELNQELDSGAERHRATNRMLEHYLHTAREADRLLRPGGEPVRLTPTQGGVTPQHLADHEQAMSWLAAQHPALVEAVRNAERAGVAAQVSWTLATFFDRRAHWHTWASGDYDEAYRQLQQALELFDARGDRSGRGRTLLALSWVRQRQQRTADARTLGRQADELYRETGDRLGQARAANVLGWVGAQLDDPDAAGHCRRAVVLHQEVGDRYGEAASWDSLGYAHHRRGETAEALDCYRQALKLHRTVGHRYDEAVVLTHIGESRAATGEHHLAAEAWQQAHAILTELDHPDAADLRTKLRATAPGRT